MAGDSFFDCFAFGSKIIICRKGKTLRQQGMSGSEMTAGSRNPYGGIPKG